MTQNTYKQALRTVGVTYYPHPFTVMGVIQEMNVLNFILQRIKERSTWLGLVSIGTAAGMTLRPDVQEAVIATGMSLAGLVLALTKDDVSA